MFLAGTVGGIVGAVTTVGTQLFVQKQIERSASRRFLSDVIDEFVDVTAICECARDTDDESVGQAAYELITQHRFIKYERYRAADPGLVIRADTNAVLNGFIAKVELIKAGVSPAALPQVRIRELRNHHPGRNPPSALQCLQNPANISTST